MRLKNIFLAGSPSRPGATLLELLLAACFLSIFLVPLFYLFKLSKPPDRKSEMEFMASLLARHVIERIVAGKVDDPDYLPSMTPEEPTVVFPEGYQAVSQYFRNILGKDNGLDEETNQKLYWALKPFKCQVDTYYLEDNMYKVIVYVSYEEDGRKKRVFLERLLDHPLPQIMKEAGG